MKRILHIVGKMDRAGAETMLMNLYRNIDREKIQFDFVVFSDRKGDYDDEIFSLGGRIIPILASNNIFRTLKLIRFLKSHKEYSIVHSHMLLNSMFSLYAAKIAGVKHRIAHSHNTVNSKKGIIAELYKKLALASIKKNSTKKIACGVAASEYLFPNHENVLLLSNGVEAEKLAVINIENHHLPYQKKRDGIVLLQVGRLSDVKNPFFTLEIAKELKKRKIKAHIYFIGQGNLEKKLIQEIDKHHLNDYITLLGLRSDIGELMTGADVLLMPSLHEGFPVVLVEAQAVGLQAIISSGISKEVDLGADLITFLNIQKPEDWVLKIVEITKENVKTSNYKRIQILKEKGFDVVQNARLLQTIYQQMF
ncbi:glycosyltransferase [Epilithonimonas arachidiradicis]|uniref:Glycosyltransferase EpsF n=1 Tax=Epilithonimonas arachidiradicis TaxID=1617282 RepID=A0A420CJA9_9FLAO|nr:glycosyltransferase [Epilithonimonas arachidiradicis]RKE78373.1 glycosyltransferase involved in cell wall biosynthesis [Epilithonimonas arachidiradicis]GGG67212.1 putative glycosyltransferase EpsF [Epilithonimonas arachidiradicis]